MEEDRKELIDNEEFRDHSLVDHLTMMYPLPHSLLNGKTLKREAENSVKDNPYSFLTKDTGFFPLPNLIPPLSSVFIQQPDYNDLPIIRNPHDSFQSPFIQPLPSQEGMDLLKDLHLAQIRRLHNLNGSNGNHPPPAHGNQLKLPLLVNVVRKLVRERVIEIKKLHRMKSRDDINDSLSDDESLGPLKAFTPTATAITPPREESLYPLVCKRNDKLSFHHSHRPDADSLLKNFGKVNECSRIGDTLKDIIGKTISEKMKFRDMSSDENSNPDYPKLYKARSLQSRNCFSEVAGTHKREADSTTQFDKDLSSPVKRSKKEMSKSRCYISKSPVEGSAKSMKKTRPKRGQYRKYNSQLLMDAVRAVQRGEMSVHRAGSFFGVPHSTLEYKVKERHLLRQRKGRESSLSSTSPTKSEAPLVTTINLSRDSSPALSEASLTSKKFNDSLNSKTLASSSPSLISNHDDKKNHTAAESTSKVPLSISPVSISCPPFHLSGRSQELSHAAWLQPYLSSTSKSDSAVVYPSPGLSLNTSASELLRKLQHKVQSKDCLSNENALHLPFTKDSSFEMVAAKENSGELAETLAVFH